MKRKATAGIVVVIFILIVTVASGPYTGFFLGGNPYQSQIDSLSGELSTTQASLTEKSTALETCESEVESKDSELLETSASLSSAQNSLATCNTNFETSQSELSTVKQNLDVKTTEASQLQEQKTTLKTENSLLVSQQEILEQGYNNLANNSAKDICCVRRVFDATLTHYYIENDKVICTSDGNKTVFSC